MKQKMWPEFFLLEYFFHERSHRYDITFLYVIPDAVERRPDKGARPDRVVGEEFKRVARRLEPGKCYISEEKTW